MSPPMLRHQLLPRLTPQLYVSMNGTYGMNSRHQAISVVSKPMIFQTHLVWQHGLMYLFGKVNISVWQILLKV